MTSENANKFLKRRQKVVNGFESKIFLIVKQAQGKGHVLHLARIAEISDSMRIEIFTPKQIIKRLAITLVKAGNTSENLLNEVHQSIDSFLEKKKLLKTYITIKKSIKV